MFARGTRPTTVRSGPSTNRSPMSARQEFSSARMPLMNSAGAPISPALLRSAAPWFPNASFHTPYGMTEVLPVADVSLEEVEEAVALHGDERGVCVGHPVPGVEVRIAPIEGADGWGEIEILARKPGDTNMLIWGDGRLQSVIDINVEGVQPHIVRSDDQLASTRRWHKRLSGLSMYDQPLPLGTVLPSHERGPPYRRHTRRRGPAQLGDQHGYT